MVDLAGATVLPGLVDSHTHVAELGEAASRVDLVGVTTEEEAVARVAARAAQVPKGEWIVGRGWDEGAWANHYPSLKLLSDRVPDHPVFLASLHSFAGWGNRMALARAGITRDTKAPEGGEIVKDAEGNPTGILLNRAVPLLADAVPPATDEQFKEYVRAALQIMAAGGYVAVHEAGAESRHMKAFEALAAEGRLPVRVYAMLSARDEDLCARWLAKGPDRDDGRRLVTRSVKAYYDGALGSRGARLLDDYSDRPGHRGVSGNQYGFDQKRVAEMMKAGFQVAVHAIGDAGNRETLDFIESVIAAQPGVEELRNRIEHAQVAASRRRAPLRPARSHRVDGAAALRGGQDLGRGPPGSGAGERGLRLAHAAPVRGAPGLELRSHRLRPRHLLRSPCRDHPAGQEARALGRAGIPRSASLPRRRSAATPPGTPTRPPGTSSPECSRRVAGRTSR